MGAWLLDPDNVPNDFHQIISRFNIQLHTVTFHQVRKLYRYIYMLIHLPLILKCFSGAISLCVFNGILGNNNEGVSTCHFHYGISLLNTWSHVVTTCVFRLEHSNSTCVCVQQVSPPQASFEECICQDLSLMGPLMVKIYQHLLVSQNALDL